MATTIHDAQTAGMMAGMTTGSRREVPAQFAHDERLRDTWLNAYDTMAQALRSYEPAPPDAPKEQKRIRPAKNKAGKAVIMAPKPVPQQTAFLRPMSSILEERLSEA